MLHSKELKGHDLRLNNKGIQRNFGHEGLEILAVVSSLDCCLLAASLYERVRFHRRQIDFFFMIL